MWRPNTLLEAMSLARTCEQRANWAPPAPQPATRGVTRPQGATAAQAGHQRRTLSQAEMATHRAQGLCFNCDEQFAPGHRCKKLYIMDMEIDPFLDDDESMMEPTVRLRRWPCP